MSTQGAPIIYQHTGVPQWGRAVVVSEESDRRAYFFEHGGRRVFMKDHPALVVVDMPETDREALGKQLLRKQPPSGRSSRKTTTTKKAPSDAMTWAEQLKLFKANYPGGFADPKYLEEHRGVETGAGKSRNLALPLAAEALSKASLESKLDAGAFGEAHQAAMSVLRTHKNVAHRQFEARKFEQIESDKQEAVMRTLFALLYGEGEYGTRFDAFVDALGLTPPSWTLATVFSAVVMPAEHTLARATLLQRQARVLEVDEPPKGTPNAWGYDVYLRFAQSLETKLKESGLPPADLWDVYSFVWWTLSEAGASEKSSKSKAPPPKDDD